MSKKRCKWERGINNGGTNDDQEIREEWGLEKKNQDWKLWAVKVEHCVTIA